MAGRTTPPGAAVVSASRTRDMVNRCPDLLARMLRGEADVRPGRNRHATRLDLADVGALVLWTKNPAPIVDCDPLRAALERFVREERGLVVLQLSVTGLGGTPVEPGMPAPEEAARSLSRVLESGIVGPRAVKLRYDPFLTVRLDTGRSFSNVRLDMLEEVLDAFGRLGVERVTASRVDVESYPAIAARLERLGARIDPPTPEEARAFARTIDSACRARGMVYSTCVSPDDRPLVDVEGCIDGRWMNGLVRQRHGRPVWDVLHNRIGRQRALCRCTYSVDIGSSPGVRTCATGGFACLYCYSHGSSLPAPVEAIVKRRPAG